MDHACRVQHVCISSASRDANSSTLRTIADRNSTAIQIISYISLNLPQFAYIIAHESWLWLWALCYYGTLPSILSGWCNYIYTFERLCNWTCTIFVLEMSNELIYTESTLSRYICTDQTKNENKYKQIGADYSVKTPGFST